VPRVNKELRDAASQLNSAAIHLLRGLRAVDREAGLTPARLSALSVLVFAGPMMLGRLAQVEDVAGPTMTRIVDGLCTLGLAERSRHPDSARSVLIAATNEGTAIMLKARDRRVDVISNTLSRMSTTERRNVVAAALPLTRLAEDLHDR
jgi:DNA-binding MarR family transcriptional regulator